MAVPPLIYFGTFPEMLRLSLVQCHFKDCSQLLSIRAFSEGPERYLEPVNKGKQLRFQQVLSKVTNVDILTLQIQQSKGRMGKVRKLIVLVLLGPES